MRINKYTMSHTRIIAAIKAKRATIKHTESIESLFINELTRFIEENEDVIANSITNHVFTNKYFIYIPTDLDTNMFCNQIILEPQISTFLNTLEAKWNVKCISLTFNESIHLAIQID